MPVLTQRRHSLRCLGHDWTQSRPIIKQVTETLGALKAVSKLSSRISAKCGAPLLGTSWNHLKIGAWATHLSVQIASLLICCKVLVLQSPRMVSRSEGMLCHPKTKTDKNF